MKLEIQILALKIVACIAIHGLRGAADLITTQGLHLAWTNMKGVQLMTADANKYMLSRKVVGRKHLKISG